jgi:hypothetical protein
MVITRSPDHVPFFPRSGRDGDTRAEVVDTDVVALRVETIIRSVVLALPALTLPRALRPRRRGACLTMAAEGLVSRLFDETQC